MLHRDEMDQDNPIVTCIFACHVDGVEQPYVRLPCHLLSEAAYDGLASPLLIRKGTTPFISLSIFVCYRT